MSNGRWESFVRSRREQLGVSQQSLAARVGVSRQALTAIEAGRQVPSTSLSIELARALGCRVEDLFSYGPPPPLEVRFAPDEDADAPVRSVLGRVRGRWVAHRARDAASAADGLLDEGGRGVTPLADPSALTRNVLVAGCAPLLGVLASHVARRSRDVGVRWVWANSRRALDLLADDLVHVAGLHLFDGASEEETAALVRERFGTRSMIVVNLTRWRQGLVVPAGNPLGITDVNHITRLGGRFARREDGAGASKLLAARLDAAGLVPPSGPLARSHDEVAQLVRFGVADAGMAIESAALAAGLAFVPLTEERFDLVMDEEVAAEAPVARLLDALTDRAFRAEARTLPGYDTSLTGQSRRVA